MPMTSQQLIALACLLAVPARAGAQAGLGTAVARVGDHDYTVIIECDQSVPELGFRTQPNRLTREAIGKSNPINIRLRRWEETDSLVLSVDKYVAWIPRPTSTAGLLEVTVEMSPNSEVRGGTPTLMTHDRWVAGERFEGGRSIRLRATCSAPAGAAPGTATVGGP